MNSQHHHPRWDSLQEEARRKLVGRPARVEDKLNLNQGEVDHEERKMLKGRNLYGEDKEHYITLRRSLLLSVVTHL